MAFLWDENNIAHMKRHGVSPWLAETVFLAGRDAIHGTSIRWRFVLEAEVNGRTYRLFFDRSSDGTRIYRNEDAHAWVQVGYAGDRWVDSDPTAGSQLTKAASKSNQNPHARSLVGQAALPVLRPFRFGLPLWQTFSVFPSIFLLKFGTH